MSGNTISGHDVRRKISIGNTDKRFSGKSIGIDRFYGQEGAVQAEKPENQTVEYGFVGDGTYEVCVFSAVTDHHGFEVFYDFTLQMASHLDVEQRKRFWVDLLKCLFIHYGLRLLSADPFLFCLSNDLLLRDLNYSKQRGGLIPHIR